MRIRTSFLAGMLSVLAAATAAFGQELGAAEVEAQIKANNQKISELIATRTPSNESNVVASVQAENRSFAHQMLTLAQQNIHNDGGEAACRWVIQNAQPPMPDFSRALTLYRHYFFRSDKIAYSCFRMEYLNCKPVQSFLSTLVKKNPDKQVQALACYTLASLKEKKSPAAATKLYQRCIDQYGKIPQPGRNTKAIGQLAEPRLYALQHLANGMQAPEIDANDADGKPMKLSDFRGKIVMLDFFGDW
jgi:hypothetical protein